MLSRHADELKPRESQSCGPQLWVSRVGSRLAAQASQLSARWLCANGRQCKVAGAGFRSGGLDTPPPRGAPWKPWEQSHGPRACLIQARRTQTNPTALVLASYIGPHSNTHPLTVQTVRGRLQGFPPQESRAGTPCHLHSRPLSLSLSVSLPLPH